MYRETITWSISYHGESGDDDDEPVSDRGDTYC